MITQNIEDDVFSYGILVLCGESSLYKKYRKIVMFSFSNRQPKLTFRSLLPNYLKDLHGCYSS
jgi:hypothetical protein